MNVLDALAVGTDTIVVEEKEDDSFSVKQRTKLDNEIIDCHISLNHNWKHSRARSVRESGI